MATFQCDPNIELNGHNTYAFLNSVRQDEFADIVKKHGLADIDREAWYPLQKVLSVLREIYESDDAMMNLISIGITTAANIDLPPDVLKLTPGEFFKLYEQLYPQRHRNGSPGSVRTEAITETAIQFICDEKVPYPDDIMYGVVYGYTRRLESTASFTVAYDEDSPRKDQGGSQTIINISWTPKT